MKSLNYVFVVGLVLLLAACTGAPDAAMSNSAASEDTQPENSVSDEALAAAADAPEQLALIVSGDPVRCVGVSEECLQVKYSADSDWEALQGRIDGFEAEPGYRYVVLVERSERDDYRLVEVREKADMVEMDGSGLGDTFWVLSGYGGMAQMDSVMPDVQVSFQFDPAENRVSGRSGCNNYIGEVEVDYARMTFKVAPMGMTRMACAEDVMAQESAYLDTLGRVASYAVEDGKLYLFTDSDEVLVFAPGEPAR
ncbi:MAG TPA: META domain-containing protein [Anaerolineales bacterium]|nr:META domain-containing protein [Anaerolineales bacterium]